MDPNISKRLSYGAVEWNKWREKTNDTIDLTHGSFEGFSFDEFDLRNANFNNANLEKATFKSASMSGAKFRNANLKSAKFVGTALVSSDFYEASLQGAYFRGANLEKSDFCGTDCRRASFVTCNLLESKFIQANCQHATFDLSILGNAMFGEADLRFACLHSADLTQTKFLNAKMGPTNLQRIAYTGEHHQQLHDFTETIRCDHWLTWGQLRLIGNLPLFSVSYTTLGFCITYINCVEAINQSKAIKFLKYPVGVPNRIALILFASIMLAIGATLYAIFCPKRVQQFAETQWVEEFGHSRLQYFSDSWSKQRWLYATFAFTVLGGTISVFLFLEFLYYAIRFLLISVS